MLLGIFTPVVAQGTITQLRTRCGFGNLPSECEYLRSKLFGCLSSRRKRFQGFPTYKINELACGMSLGFKSCKGHCLNEFSLQRHVSAHESTRLARFSLKRFYLLIGSGRRRTSCPGIGDLRQPYVGSNIGASDNHVRFRAEECDRKVGDSVFHGSHRVGVHAANKVSLSSMVNSRAIILGSFCMSL